MNSIQKVVIFGGTGMTGLCCIDAALKEGLDVTVFVRDPSKLPTEFAERVSIITGDALDEYDVRSAIQGQDAVISVLGTRNDLSATTMMSEGTKNIISAMQFYGVMRIAACMSSFIFWDDSAVPERFWEINTDHKRLLEVLKASDRDWVAIMPPHITAEPGTEDYLVEHGSSPGHTISKYDLGHFFIQTVMNDEHIHQLCGLSDRPE